jgi:hypothetical protein
VIRKYSNRIKENWSSTYELFINGDCFWGINNWQKNIHL